MIYCNVYIVVYRGEDIKFKLRNVFAENMLRSKSADYRIVAKILLA
jgi:hypothetical protein